MSVAASAAAAAAERQISASVAECGSAESSDSAARKALEAARIAMDGEGPARRLLSVGAPKIGDVKVRFTEVGCRTVTILAAQKGVTTKTPHTPHMYSATYTNI